VADVADVADVAGTALVPRAAAAVVPLAGPAGLTSLTAQAGEPVTLAAVERALAVRVGPFANLVVEQGLAPAVFQCAALRSTIELGGYENLFALRRGMMADGTLVPGYDARDRVRLVKTYTPASGAIEVDRDYSQNCAIGEWIELHVLDPDAELRPAVLAGLERCFALDRLPLDLTNGGTGGNGWGSTAADVTALYPWVSEPSQVWDVEVSPTATTTPPAAPNGEGDYTPVPGWGVVLRAGNVFVVLPGCGWPAQGVRAALRRPLWTLVDGLEVLPTHVWDDGDVLSVALPYAAAAAHVEAWRIARARLVPVAQTGMFPSRQEAAAEFTRATARFFRPGMRPPEERLVPSATSFWGRASRRDLLVVNG
jgi:hypothetical protein